MNPLSKLTLHAILERSADEYKQQMALTFVDGEPITFAELHKQVGVISAFLHDRGVAPGDRVAILSENSPHWGIAYFAITTMGAVAVPILPDFHANEIHHIIRHSGAQALFVSERLYYKVEEYSLESLSSVILIDTMSIINPETPKAMLKNLIAEGSRELTKIKTLAMQLVGILPERPREEDVAAIIYTSGTMGSSKGVMLTHRNVVSNAIATSKIVSVVSGDRMLSILPLAHVYECTLGLVVPIMLGAAVYYITKPPTAPVLLPALQNVKPTVMLSVPLIIEKMYKMRILPAIHGKKVLRGAYKIPALRKKINRKAGKKLLETFGGELKLFCIGGAALAPDAEQFLREARFPYAIGYGLTETAPLVTGTDPKGTRYRSAGLPLPGVEVRIDSPDPKTGEGEISVRGENIMKGYYRNEQATNDVLDKQGWLRTGDLGFIDPDGYVFIKGRLKNVILGPSGENIYPEGIEAVINRNELVLESLVYQVEEKLVARIHLDYEKIDEALSTQKMSDSQIRQHISGLLEGIRREVNGNVSSFSRLSRVIEQPEPFDKTPTQKIKRYLYVD
jgi:long-chain acyl-CoA synthetase